MLTRLANLGIRAPRRVLVVAGLIFVAGALFGAPVAKHLSAGGFNDPNAASSEARDLLASRFNAGDPNLVFEVTTAHGADSAAARAEGQRIVGTLAGDHNVSQVASYWTVPSQAAAGLRSKDGRSGLVVARVAGDDDVAPKRAGKLADALAGDHGDVQVRAGGIAMGYHQVNVQVREDLAKAEAIAIPLTTLVLIWVFGSFVAALLPLAVGLFSIISTMATLRGLALTTDVSIYALNLTTALGLALAIDYSLFIVSRYREEIRAGVGKDEAVMRTVQTAGRTVLFSAMTVALSLSALLVFPQYFLRSFAYAGIAVVALAALAALVVLPALLALLGPRVNSLDIRVPVRRWLHRAPPAVVEPEQSFWYRVAKTVMRRAVPIGLAVVALLVVLGAPFLGARFGYPDDRVLQTSATARQVGDSVRSNYTQNATGTVSVVVPDTSAAPDAVGAYAARLSTVDGVTSVGSAAGTYARGSQVAPPAGPPMTSGNSTYLKVSTTLDPYSKQGASLVSALKRAPAPWHVMLTGLAAENVDSLNSLGAKLPYALGGIALATFAILFLFTGSVFLPVKALVLNVLSLSATFGAMVWIFQDGHLNIFGAAVTGYLVPTMPILMFCLAFGMSMDYEVFLLSRIREEWVASARTDADNARAVSMGLARTGRLVTAAAVLMAIVFAAMTTSKVSFMQMFGLGLTLAVLMDATLVRGLLVPAFMRLLGRANWWAPAPMARWHTRRGLSDSAPPPRREPAVVDA
ncbi:MAG TPA: MMPL family transporter [Jatrophihabitantaceae bacterium]|nr:MMPL family transporter [Jatrophihabitantaceae bacterium]